MTQAQIDALGTPDPDREGGGLFEITYRESSVVVENGTQNLYNNISGGDCRQGRLDLVVDIPANSSGLWRLGVTNALGRERFAALVLPIGPQIIQITNVEAGNCLVSLAAINSDNTMTSYHRELPVIVRKNTPGLASMQFVRDDKDPQRYRLYSLAVGQNSQNENGTLPLTQNRDAMVRVMAYDAKGAGPSDGGYPLNLEIDALNVSGTEVWTTTLLNQQIGTHLAKTGRISQQGPGPIIPGPYVQPGMRIVAKLLDSASGQMLDSRQLQPSVVRPRKIIIHGYDVRPYRGDSGCPLARTPSQMNTCVLPYAQEIFPYSDVEYRYAGKVYLMDYGMLASRGVMTTSAAMVLMNVFQGMHQTNANADVEHLYLAMMNQKYGSASYPGMAWYGYRGLALTCMDDKQSLGYDLAHEMGHCFGLEHVPSAGANSYFMAFRFNRIDQNYPYGGAGLAGGWGYSAIDNYFLAEDSQTLANNCQAHWDPMSYTIGLRHYYSTRFCDTYAQRLNPNLTGTQASDTSLGSTSAPVSLVTLPNGIQVFDSTSAAQLQAWWAGQAQASVNTMNMALPRTTVTPNADGSDPLEGLDLSQGDADDPEPPVLVVVQTPAISGVTVAQ